MSQSTIVRGRPLRVLASILGAWLVGRVLFWNPLFPHAIVPPADATTGEPRHALVADAERFGGGPVERVASVEGNPVTFDLSALPFTAQIAAVAARSPPALSPRTNETDYSPARPVVQPEVSFVVAPGRGALKGLVAQPSSAPAQLAGPAPTFRQTVGIDRPLLGASAAPDERRQARLSGDGWILWRDGSATSGTPGGPTYGRSQAGAVLRYRLLAGHAHLPEVYARATRTLEGFRQTEVAAGLSFRPLARVPLTLAGEARVTQTSSGRELRPAAFAVAQVPPVALPLGLAGEAYVQGGYVGGRFGTAFIDGQARIDGKLVQVGNDDGLRLGIAAWGGAQEGSARLDIGPSAVVAFKIGEARARIAVDYRKRIAGGAAPVDGPAVTFSAGF